MSLTSEGRLAIIRSTVAALGLEADVLFDGIWLNIAMPGDGGGVSVSLAQGDDRCHTLVRLPLGEPETRAKLELLLRLDTALQGTREAS